MASVVTNYLGNAVLKKYFGDSRVQTYLALFTADPGVLGSLTDEVAGGDYVRQKFMASSPGTKTCVNNTAITFDNLPACTVTHLAWADAQYGGHLLIVTARLATPFVVPDSARLVIPGGDIAISL